MSQNDPISQYARPRVLGLHAYTPGLQPKETGWVKLNTNENPYPPSPQVDEAIKQGIGDALRLYPDPSSTRLREAIAKLHGVSADCVIVGNGSDDVLNLLTRVFSGEGGTASMAAPCYSLYPVLCGIQGADAQVLPFGREMALPHELIARAESNILFITSPNAPTGVGYQNADLAKAIGAFKGVVVVDEAYADFAKENAIALLAKHPNLVVTRTFSKSYGLAGIRLGYGVASPAIIDLLDRVRDSYNVNRLSQAAGLAAIQDQGYLKAIVGKIKYTRDSYIREFRSLGWFVYDSQTNFIFAEPVNAAGKSGPEVARDLYDFLLEHKILVRYFPGHALTASFLRISVGDDDQMLSLSETIEKWLKTA